VPFSEAYSDIRFQNVGYDPEPGLIALISKNIVAHEVADRLSFESSAGSEHQWVNGSDVFISSMPSGLDTGVLRYHASRLNSSVTCENIPSTSFPTTCSGSRPFFGDVTVQQDSQDPGSAHVRWCAPGAYDVSPWTRSRDRQDIVEEFFLDVSASTSFDRATFENSNPNFTTHCSASTTKGYFELPNYYNQHQPGPLLDKWPSTEDLAANFNDVGSTYIPTPLWEM
jgi:hypothetical protein